MLIWRKFVRSKVQILAVLLNDNSKSTIIDNKSSTQKHQRQQQPNKQNAHLSAPKERVLISQLGLTSKYFTLIFLHYCY